MKARERIYIVPHWAGIGFGAGVFALFIAGYFIHGFGGLPQTLVISLVVAGIVALIQTNENLRGVALVSCHSQPVPEGGEVVLEVTFANFSDRDRLGLQVRTRAGWKLSGGASLPVLRPGERKTVRLSLPAKVRGRYENPDIWVSGTFPLGLCFAWKTFSASGVHYVYPRPVGRPFEEVIFNGNGEGVLEQKGTDDVGGHRPYVAGDLLARMDWKVFARSEKLVVKTFEGSGGDRILLRWEDTAFLDDPEARLRQLSFWISECQGRRRIFELHLPSGGVSGENPTACRVTLATFPRPS